MSKFSSSRPGPYPRTGYPGPTGVEGPYLPDTPYQNPTYSAPGPLGVENRGYWTGPEVPVVWRFIGNLVNPVVPTSGAVPAFEATWESPVFDLRPDLKASASAEYQAAYPIFRGGAFGAGGTLQILVRSGDGGFIHTIPTMRVCAQEIAGLSDPNLAISITPPPVGLGASGAIDVTSEFYQGNEGVLLNFIPPCNPVRYWQTKLFFRFIAGLGQQRPPVLFAQGVAQ